MSKKKDKPKRISKEELAIREKIRAEEKLLKAQKRKRVLSIVFASIAGVLTLMIILSVVISPKTAVSINGDYTPSMILIIKNGSDGATRPSGTVELNRQQDINAEQFDRFLTEHKKATEFSFASGFLHQVWFPSLKLNLDDDGNPTIPIDSLQQLKGTESQPLVVVRYNTPVSQKIKGVTITYDRVYFYIADTVNNIVEFNIYLADSNQMNSLDSKVRQEYRAYQLNGWGNSSRMWDVYQDALANV